MESKLDTLSTVIIVSGVISSLIVIAAGVGISFSMSDSYSTASMSAYILIASLIIGFFIIIFSLAVAFSLQAKAEQLETESKIKKECHSINSYLEILSINQAYAHQTETSSYTEPNELSKLNDTDEDDENDEEIAED